jgi:DNA-binding GntR family transcriptional regulator
MRMRQPVYERLRTAIIRLDLEPGRRLSENELAERFEISRTPIREALIRLSEDRLVEIVPQLGTFVAAISEATVAEALFVRESIELAAVRLAAERATDEDVGALRSLVKEQQKARRAKDLDRFHEFDDEFHRQICELSGHPIAWALVVRANSHLERLRRLSVPRPRDLSGVIAEHERLIDAIARRDPDAAESTLSEHFDAVLAQVDALRATHPELLVDG